jgi:glycosyltransferase involved in cell wall biosynthesis
MREKLAIIWTHFGPYHMARIQALKIYFDVRAIELASDQRLYRWSSEETDTSVHTLTSGDWEDQNKVLVTVKVWRELNRARPGILLVHGYSSITALCAAAWGRTHGAKTILMSESNFDDHRRHRLAEAIKRTIIALLFDAGIVGGKRAAAYLERLGMSAERIARAYDVVDNEYFSSRAAQCRREAEDSESSTKAPYFVYVGRLAPEKNISALLEAFGQYRDAGGTWSLVIVGDGPLNESLREQARILIESGAVVFTGRKNVHELPFFYAFAGCFVLPSVREPWGLVVNEAMASGLPVIVSSRCGCADDLVADGSNGFIIDSTRISGIVEALTRMSNLSAADRSRMGELSMRIIADYAPEIWASEVNRIASVVGKAS